MTRKEPRPVSSKERAKDSRAASDAFAEVLRPYGGDINKFLADRTAKRARDGDTYAAMDILRDFVGAIDQYNERTWSGLRSAPIHWEYVRYIADAFEKIVRAAMRSRTWIGTKWNDVESGEAQPDANLALGITTSKPGRRKGTRTHDQEALAAAYWFLIRRGWQPEAAIGQMSAYIGADRTTIQRASRAEGNIAYKYPQLICDESLKVAMKPYAAKITAILAADKKQ